MGNSNCKCSCNKDSEQTENFINNLEDPNNINNENENENFNMPQLNNQNNDLKSFIQGKKNSDQINFKSSNSNINNNNNLNNSNSNFKFNKDNMNQNDTTKIIKIQSCFRGYSFRKYYNNELKNILVQEVNQLIKDLTEQYTKFNLKRAESLIGTKFDN